jgi:hypothetical protein
MSALSEFLLAVFLLQAPVAEASSQESLPDETPETQPVVAQRIVEGRPALYRVKRALHPLTWVSAALKPAFKSAEGGWIYRVATREPPTNQTSAMWWSVGGMGSGSGIGPNWTYFHKNVFGRGVYFETPLTYTYRQYELYRMRTSVPLATRATGETLRLDIGTSYMSRTQDHFYGIGNSTSPGEDSLYREVSREITAGLVARLNDEWDVSLHGAYRRVGVTEPASGESAQERFRDASVPGLAGGGALRSIRFSINRDTERRENYFFKGGVDSLEVSFNESADGSEFQYLRYGFRSHHYVPLSRDGRKVLVLGGWFETNHSPEGRQTPFFDMPVLGTSQALRGFDNYRFRDKTALALTLEYRYRIWRAMDLGFFLDQGQVASGIRELAFDRFHTGYGARLFIWAKPTAPISLDYGRSRETWRFYVNFAPRF